MLIDITICNPSKLQFLRLHPKLSLLLAPDNLTYCICSPWFTHRLPRINMKLVLDSPVTAPKSIDDTLLRAGAGLFTSQLPKAQA